MCLLALVLLLCGLFLLPNAEAIGVSERAEQQRQRRLREGPSGKTKASSPSDETPAEETVRGIEKVIATTFVKINRTIAFKKHDDETFDRQEKQATDLVANHEKMVEEAKACVKNEEVRNGACVCCERSCVPLSIRISPSSLICAHAHSSIPTCTHA